MYASGSLHRMCEHQCPASSECVYIYNGHGARCWYCMCCRALLAVGCRVIIYSHLPGSNFDIKLSRSSQVYPAITMIEVAHKLVLSNQHVKGWLPTSKVVDGIEFVELNQWDRKFFRFCTGKFLTFRKGEGHMAHTKFYDYLLEQRTASSRAAFEAARQTLHDEAEGDETPLARRELGHVVCPMQQLQANGSCAIWIIVAMSST
jgi:hypothetical protein